MADATVDKRKYKNNLYKLSIVIIVVMLLIFWGQYFQKIIGIQDVFFLEHDITEHQTTVYEYCSKYNEPIAITTVDGWFHNAKVDENKEYIIGFRGNRVDMETSPADIIRISLKDGSTEVYFSNEEIVSILGDTFTTMDSEDSFIDDNGEKIFFGGSYVLYDVSRKEKREIGTNLDQNGIRIWLLCDLQDGILWATNREERVVGYDMRNGELMTTLNTTPREISIYNSEKMAYIDFDYTQLAKKLYIYEKSGESKCIGRVGWNTFYEGIDNAYQIGWDKDGNYLLYITSFPGFVGENTMRMKAYNLRNGWTHTFYSKNMSGNMYEFVKND